MSSLQTEDARLALIDRSLRRSRYAQDELIELLHAAQDIYGSLSDEVLLHLASALRLPPSMVYGVATFYHLFVFEPPGEHACTVCTGTACFVKGADRIVEALRGVYGIDPGQTSPDGRLTLTTGRCLGSCGMAPVVVLDGEVLGNRSADEVRDAIADVLAQGAPAADPASTPAEGAG